MNEDKRVVYLYISNLTVINCTVQSIRNVIDLEKLLENYVFMARFGQQQ